ncbi:hypothetical protein RCG17_00560 [Neobacillus sp. PS3-12]|uniref:hypothetical protein n=1 Tax=Neobacillus sp. PS3-12 TaxID=3070677 RepID=UPI0027DFECA7|nr:hypothetical protein [Neobacillus sp. PS3-12]WML53242.1 hypothetical protein RCG17_00560 [Neobacillus sp. PS3-12]
MSTSIMSACLKKTVGSATDNVTPPGGDVPAITSTLSWFFSSSRPIFPKNENRIKNPAGFPVLRGLKLCAGTMTLNKWGAQSLFEVP